VVVTSYSGPLRSTDSLQKYPPVVKIVATQQAESTKHVAHDALHRLLLPLNRKCMYTEHDGLPH